MNLEQLVKSRMEATEPQGFIRNYLADKDGKQFTERDIKKLNAGCPGYEFRLTKNYGMSNIEWGDYGSSGGRKGGSLLLAYTEKNIIIDCKKIIDEYNGRYFSALDERNERRRKLLADPALMQDFEARVAEYLKAKVVLAQQHEHVSELLDDFNGVFQPDCYAIQEHLLGEKDWSKL